MSELNTKYIESVDSTGEDALGRVLDLMTDSPYVLLTVEDIQEDDGLTPEETEAAGGFKVVVRIGNGIKDRQTVRTLLQKALLSIPE